MSVFLTATSGKLPHPVRRVYCVGRNYAEHRKEMGGSDRDEPFFFHKPHDAIFQVEADNVVPVKYPRGTKKYSYEAELVVVMGSCKEIYGYALGVDFTKRDVQEMAKKMGRPWESGKSFDNSGLVGIVHTMSHLREDGRLSFTQNGITKQSSEISNMIWPVADLIEKLVEQDFSVEAGDVIFTGTPAGVGELHVGDRCVVSLTEPDGSHVLSPLKFSITDNSIGDAHY